MNNLDQESVRYSTSTCIFTASWPSDSKSGLHTTTADPNPRSHFQAVLVPWKCHGQRWRLLRTSGMATCLIRSMHSQNTTLIVAKRLFPLTNRKQCVNQHGAGGAADVEMDKVHLLTSQQWCQHILHRETGTNELCWWADNAQRHQYVSKCKQYSFSIHVNYVWSTDKHPLQVTTTETCLKPGTPLATSTQILQQRLTACTDAGLRPWFHVKIKLF